MKRWPRIVACAALLAAWHVGALAALTAALDRDRIAPGETVQLTLAHDSRGGDPDLAPLAADFDILGRSSASSLRIVGGHISSEQQLTLTLAPRRSGTLHVPPLHWDADVSPPLTLVVEAGAGGAAPPATPGDSDADSAAPVGIGAKLETPRPYVQQPVMLTVRVRTSVPLSNAGLGFEGDADVIVEPIGKDSQRTEVVGGREVQIIERRYRLLPQRSGHIELPGPLLEAQIPDPRGVDPAFGGLFGRMPIPGFGAALRPLHLRAAPVVLDVRPRAVSGGDWLPARSLTLQETWSPDSSTLHVGDPVTRRLTITAAGLSAAQLPDLAKRLALPEGLKAYPDQPRLDDQAQDGSSVGRREQDVALIATRPGRMTLPELRLAWWDTQHDQARVAVLPARTIEVLPAAGASASSAANPTIPGATAATPPTAAAPAAAPAMEALAPAASAAIPPAGAAVGASNWIWPAVTATLALLWLATAALWWRDRKRLPPRAARPAPPSKAKPRSAAEALRDLDRACAANSPLEARAALQAWAAAHWPGVAPAGLQALAQRLGAPALAEPLRELDRACFAGTPWRGGELSRALRAAAVGSTPKPGADPLGSLYDESGH
ncbi:MAG: protein BatD [Burkholderiales bacterium]|nr:protein BatD [Burkholderiales bacterium]